MANETIYPYGTNGQLPSSIGVINDLTTGGADKALSAEMGKVLNNQIEDTSVTTSKKGYSGDGGVYYSITNSVLNINNPITSQSWSQVGSVVVEVVAGQSVTWHGSSYQVSSVHKFIFAACDSSNNVLYSSTAENGTYNVVEDGYVVVQGWNASSGTTYATVTTHGLKSSKADKTEVSSLVDAAVSQAMSNVDTVIDGLKYTKDIVPIIGWSQKAKLNSTGAFSSTEYADTSDFVEISPSTKMLVTLVSNGTSGAKEDPLICFYSKPESGGFISKVAANSISATGTEVTAPSNARYFRLTFAHRYNYPYGQNVYSVRLEIKSFLAGLSEERDKEWYFNLPAYVDGVSGAPATVFCEQFMSGVDDFLIRGSNNHSAQTFITEHGEKAIRFPATGDNAILLCRKNTVNEPIYRVIIQTVSDVTGTFHKVVKSRINSRSVGDGTESRNILFIGDSLMANNSVSQTETLRLLEQDNDYTFHLMTEATQGWKYSDHLTNSKFLNNNVLDFKHYMETYHASIASGGIDYVIINLGTNDIRSNNRDTIVANAKTLIDAILDETTGYPNAKIAVGLPALGAPFDDKEDFAYSSAASFKMGMLKLNARLISEFDNGAYNANVTTMAHGAYIYGWESYPHQDVSVNDYCETTMRRFNATPNGTTIHPADIGYKQWGFAYYCKIRAFIAGNL